MPGSLTISHGPQSFAWALTELRGHDTTSTSDRDKDTRHDLNDNCVVSIDGQKVETHTTGRQLLPHHRKTHMILTERPNIWICLYRCMYRIPNPARKANKVNPTVKMLRM